MAELVLRAGHNDHLAVADLLAVGGMSLTARQHTRRLVVNATVAGAQEGFANAAAGAAHQFLIDPQTTLLTSAVAPGDSWLRLPFAVADPLTPRDLSTNAQRDRLVQLVVDHELALGATGIIPPYIHMGDVDVWASAQVDLYQRTSRYLAHLGLSHPIIPVISVDLAKISLDRAKWDSSLGHLVRNAVVSTDQPVALALSRSGSHPTRTALHAATVTWRRASQIGRVIAWQAGDVGPLAVAVGAAGYETGLCAREHCNVSADQARHRSNDPDQKTRGVWTGVYLDVLNRSVARQAVSELVSDHRIAGDLVCADATCCPNGSRSMLDDQRRQHAIRSRLANLDDLSRIATLNWRLRHLQVAAVRAEEVARRITSYAERHKIERHGVQVADYTVLAEVASALRATNRLVA